MYIYVINFNYFRFPQCDDDGTDDRMDVDVDDGMDDGTDDGTDERTDDGMDARTEDGQRTFRGRTDGRTDGQKTTAMTRRTTGRTYVYRRPECIPHLPIKHQQCQYRK